MRIFRQVPEVKNNCAAAGFARTAILLNGWHASEEMIRQDVKNQGVIKSKYSTPAVLKPRQLTARNLL